jgi:hypothetical protein
MNPSFPLERMNTTVLFRDLLDLHRQGRCGEWLCITDICTRLSDQNFFLLVCYAVGRWSQSVWSLIHLSTMLLNVVSLFFFCMLFFVSSWESHDVYVLECYDSMLCWVWTPSLSFYCSDIILFLLLFWQVSPCSLMFWLVLQSHGTWFSAAFCHCGLVWLIQT